MSDNVLQGPAHWIENARRDAKDDLQPAEVLEGGGGGGPDDPMMEVRVSALETDMKDVKAGISRLELSGARIEAALEARATKVELTALAGTVTGLTERLHAHGETLSRVEIAMRDLGSKVDAKLVSGGQMFVIFGGLMSLFFVLGGIAIGALRFFKMLP